MLRAGTARTWRGAVTTRTSKKERTSPMASRVLLIDDDVRLYELLASYLEQNGFTATSVPDGAKGLAALAGGRLDPVHLDGFTARLVMLSPPLTPPPPTTTPP